MGNPAVQTWGVALASLFLSYKSEDRPRAEKLVRMFEAAGITIWWDQNLGAGDSWRQQLSERLDAASVVLVLWSVRSMGPEGNFVHDEASRAMRRGTYLPVRLDHGELPLGFGALQAFDLTGWQGSSRDPRLNALLDKVQARMAASGAGTAGDPATVVPKGAGRAPIGRRSVIAGAAVVGVGAGLALLAPAIRSRLGPAGARSGSQVTIAVLPFRPLSEGEQAGLLAEGLTEELRIALSRTGLIRVAARTSSDSFAGSSLETQEIAKRLRVQWLVDGSVRVGDDRARVTTALAEAATGLANWNKSFDHGLDDLIAMQQAIATAVATELVGTLGPAAAAATGRVPTRDSEAYGAYLRGRRLLDTATDSESDRAALAAFDTAIARDPGFARAHAARARALQALSNASALSAERDSLAQAALEAAREAVERDPGDATTQSTLGFVLMYGQLDFPAARQPFEAAFRLAPDDSDILIRHGLYHSRAGDMATGLALLERATRLDPYNPRAFRTHAFALLAARRHRESIAEINKGLALNPNLSAAQATIGDNLLGLGDAAAALAAYGREVQDFSRLTGLAIAHHRLGQKTEARRAFADLEALGDGVSYQRAQVLAQWGEADAALAALDRAIALRDGGVPLMRNDPFLDPLRALPAFRQRIEKLGFA